MDKNNQPIVQPPVQPVAAPQGEKKVGPIVATLIIVLILIIAALYLFASKINQEPTLPGDDSLATRTTVQTPAPTPVDDISSLEAELDASTSGLEEENF